jgi:hypothetical protein
MSLRPALLTSLLAALAGCGTGPDEERIFGTYSLVSVEGNSLPYLDQSDPNCDIFISEGELRLVVNGTYGLEFSGLLDCSRSGGPADGSIGRFYSGRFSRNGSTLGFEVHIQGFGDLQFSGTAGSGEAEVAVPPIPPQTGPVLSLQFQLSPGAP